MKKLIACYVLSAATLLAQSNQFDGQTWWSHVKVLAADDMEGRDTGSAGLRRAEAYVVEQLKKDGLQPAGSNGFYQPIKFKVHQIDESQSSLAIVRNGKTEPITLGEEATLGTRTNLAPHLQAPLVFIGYGLRIPEMHYDDLAGQDLKGKVVVLFTGSPSNIPGPLASHYQSQAERWKALREAGAVGYITLPNPAATEIPWSRTMLSRNRPTMTLADPAMNETDGCQLSATINPAHADKILEGSGHNFSEIAALGKDRKPLPHFAIPASIVSKAKIAYTEIEASNIVAKLPGSDPKLKNEYVVLSAHIDHLGIGEPINGDRIYNGAIDNASGSAVLLDVADALKKSPTQLKRSLLFVFVVGEEKGLLGSHYFATHSTVPQSSMISDINIDMFMPITPLKIMTVYGLDESSLGSIAAETAKKDGISVQADPEPLRNIFIRSDQYSFIKEGVPAIAMKVGFELGSPEAKVHAKWLSDRYHAPSDDLNQPIDFPAAAKYEQIVADIMATVANSEHTPRWKQDSFFRRFAKQKSDNGD